MKKKGDPPSTLMCTKKREKLDLKLYFLKIE